MFCNAPVNGQGCKIFGTESNAILSIDIVFVQIIADNLDTI